MAARIVWGLAALLLLTSPSTVQTDGSSACLQDNHWSEESCCWRDITFAGLVGHSHSDERQLHVPYDKQTDGVCLGANDKPVEHVRDYQSCLMHCMEQSRNDTVRLSSSCQKTKQNAVSPSTKPAKIAFLIMIHKDFRMFQRLFKAMYDAEIAYYIVNCDNSQMKPQVAQFLNEFGKGNVHLTDYSIVWGDNSMARAEMLMINKLLEMGADWQYVINLSGADFPLRPVASMHEWLNKNGEGKNFVVGMEDLGGSGHSGWRWRAEGVWGYRRDLGKYTLLDNFPNRTNYPKGLAFKGGWSWWTLHRTFCEYLVSNDPLPRVLLQFGDSMGNSDEVYVQTVLANSPFCFHVRDGHAKREAPHPLVEWNPSDTDDHPYILGMEHWQLLKNAESFFARKFDGVNSAVLLERIEQELWPQHMPAKAKDVKTVEKNRTQRVM